MRFLSLKKNRIYGLMFRLNASENNVILTLTSITAIFVTSPQFGGFVLKFNVFMFIICVFTRILIFLYVL